jgi:hypothetical protein
MDTIMDAQTELKARIRVLAAHRCFLVRNYGVKDGDAYEVPRPLASWGSRRGHHLAKAYGHDLTEEWALTGYKRFCGTVALFGI